MEVLVFGQGKSGTTVIAKAIQHSLPNAKFLMEPKTEEALNRRGVGNRVVKILHGQWVDNIAGLTRVLQNESVVSFDRVVQLIRDPRDQAISFLLYNFYSNACNDQTTDAQLREIIALLREKEQRPAALSFTALCAEVNRILGWNGFSSQWLFLESGLVADRAYWRFLESLRNFGFLMRYESFMEGDLAQLQSYLGIKLSANREVGEYARTKRSASWGKWQEFFTPEDVALLQPPLGELLQDMGYSNWQLKPVETLNPAHFSGYLEMLLREARPGSA